MKKVKKKAVEHMEAQPEKEVEQPQEKKVEAVAEQSQEKKEEKLEDISYIPFDKMNDNQMEYHLFELSTTVYWQAILRYIYKRDSEILGTLAGVDPFKDPTLMSRHQGERIGIYNIKHLVDSLIQRNKDAVKTKEQKNIEDKSVPGYKW
jgi:hypothetical protein